MQSKHYCNASRQFDSKRKLKPQEITFDHSDSNCRFVASHEKPLLATSSAIETYSLDVIVARDVVLRGVAEMAVEKGATVAAKNDCFGSRKGGHLVAWFHGCEFLSLRFTTLLEPVTITFDR